MGRKLALDVLNRVIIHFEAGETVREAHKATKVAKPCLYKLCLNIDLWGSPYPPPVTALASAR
jgi:hypothetical protein